MARYPAARDAYGHIMKTQDGKLTAIEEGTQICANMYDFKSGQCLGHQTGNLCDTRMFHDQILYAVRLQSGSVVWCRHTEVVH